MMGLEWGVEGVGSTEQGTSQSLSCSEGTSKQTFEERGAINQANRGMGGNGGRIFLYGQKEIHSMKVQRPGGARHI